MEKLLFLLRVTTNGSFEEIRIQRSIPVAQWNQAKGCCKGKDKASTELNNYIKDLTVKLWAIRKQLVLEEAYFSPALLPRKLFGNEDKKTLLIMYKQHIEECRKLIGQDYEAVTINRYARHTFGTTVTLANNVSLQNVSKMMGHSSTRMTEHYAKVLDQNIYSDMQNVEAKLAEMAI